MGDATEATPTTPAAPAAPAATPAPAGDTKPVEAGHALGGEPSADKAAKPAAETKPAEGDAKAKSAPTLVDDKWEPKAVEGLTRDSKGFSKARDAFKELGFNTEQAQKLVDLSDALAKDQAVAAEAARKEQHQTWWKELQADKDFGGSKFEENMQAANRLLRSLKAGEEVVNSLREAGLTNWPPLVRAFAELAQRTSEDSVAKTVVDPAAAAVNEHERRVAKTYGTTTRKES